MPMNDDDLVWLARQIAATSELLGQELKPNVAAMLADDLSVYDRAALSKALQRVRTEHTGKLTLKAIIDRIDELAGRLPANEAWSMALSALDERNTVIWSEEASTAWSIARPVADSGDMVGARMAFISAYERLVRTARDERRPPKVSVSLGWDADLRAVALEKAVASGYLTQEDAAKHAPESAALPWVNHQLLLAGKAEPSHGATAEQRRRLSQLRDDLATLRERKDAERARKVREEAEAFARQKAEIQRRVDERLQAEGGQS